MAGLSVLDKTNSIISFEDSGIGFKKNELGTIAKSVPGGDMLGSSGLASFRPICLGQDSCLSKNNYVEQYIWETAAAVSFTVQNDAEMVHGEVLRGTKIIFCIKEDQSEFLGV